MEDQKKEADEDVASNEAALRIWPRDPISQSFSSSDVAPAKKKRPPPGFVPQTNVDNSLPNRAPSITPELKSEHLQASFDVPLMNHASEKPFAVPAPKKRPPPGFQNFQTDAEGFAVPLSKKKPPPGLLGQRVEAERGENAEIKGVTIASERFLSDFEGDDDDDEDDEEDVTTEKAAGLPEKPKVQATWLESLLAFGTGSGNNEEDDEMFVSSSSSYFDSLPTSVKPRPGNTVVLDSVCDPIPEGDEEGDALDDDFLESYDAEIGEVGVANISRYERADETEDPSVSEPDSERTYCEDDV